MANAIQCVFLLDENVFCGETSSQIGLCDRLRLTVLRVLCYLCTSRAKSSDSVRWSFKFFDSGGGRQQLTEKQSLLDFTLENFEDFESCLIVKAERKSAIKCLDVTKCNTSDAFNGPVEMLKLAFHQLYSDYMWDLPDISSPIKRSARSRCNPNVIPHMHENYIFVLASHDVFISSSVGCRSNPFKKLLPKSLYDVLSSLVNLLWIDTHFTASEATSKIARPCILPLHTITEGKTCSNLPLSSLMNSLLESKSATAQPKDQEDCYPSISLFLKGKELCQLSLFSLQQTLDDKKCNYDKGNVLGSLPISWLSRVNSLVHHSLVGSPVCTSQDTSIVSTFNNLLQQLKKNQRMLVLQLTQVSGESSGDLHLLQPFGQGLCILLPLAPKMTLLSLIRSRQMDKLEHPTSKFTTSILEKWSVPVTQPSFLEDLKHERSQLRTRNLQALQKYCNLSSVLTLKKASRRKPLHSGTPKKVLSEQALPKSSSKSLRKVQSSVDLSQPCSDSAQRHRKRELFCLNEVLPVKSSELVTSSKDNTVIQSKGGDKQDDLNGLRDLYDDAVKGEKSLDGVAETLTQSLLAHACSQSVDVNSLATREHFLLSAKAVADKHEMRGDPKGLGRQRELQLQALLQLEMQSASCTKDRQPGYQELNAGEKLCLQEVVVLLRTFSFLAGALELNKFLLETLKLRYGDHLCSLLREIGEELNIPLASDSDSSSDNEESVAGVDNPLSVLSLSSSSSLSSVNHHPPDKKSSHKSWGRALSMVVPTCTRQIKVPRNLVNFNHFSKTLKKKKVGENKKSSVKKSKIRMSDERTRVERRKACKNLLEKLNQSRPTPLENSLPGFSPSKNYWNMPESSPKTAQKKARLVTSKSSSSPKRKDSGSPSRRHKLTRTTPIKCQSVSHFPNSQPHTKSPRTPCRKSKSAVSIFTPSDEFPDLMNTPKEFASKSPCRTPRRPKHPGLSPSSCNRSKNKSPRTPKQKIPMISGFTPSEKFPALLNTPKEWAKYASPRRTPCSTRKKKHHLELSPAVCTRSKLNSPGTSKQNKVLIASGFTSNETFPALTRTPEEYQSPCKTPLSSCRKHHLRQSPAVCGSSKTHLTPSRKLPAQADTPNEKSTRQSSCRTPRNCFTKPSLDTSVDSESPTHSLNASSSWKTPTSSRISRRRSYTENAVQRSGSSSYIRKLALDSPCKHSNIEPLNSTHIKECVVMLNKIDISEASKNIDKTPEKSEVFKEKIKTENATPSPNKFTTPLKFHSLESPYKLYGVSHSVQPKVLLPKFQCSYDTRATTAFSESFGAMVSQSAQSVIQLSKECKNTESPKVCRRLVTRSSLVQKENFNSQVVQDEPIQVHKDPILQLSKLPENCDKNLKTSPNLSMRWPQKKRKRSPVKKRGEKTSVVTTSPVPKDPTKWLTPPSNKKHQKITKYASPSTMSIFHLTTSPVITLKDCFLSD